MMTAWQILVVWRDGTTEYLKQGSGALTAVFPSRERAEAERDFLLEGIEDEVQSINVVVSGESDAGNR